MSCNDKILTTKGLKLRKNPDGESYSLVSIGNCAESNISVGVCEDGLPVVIIEEEALRGAKIESIILGESVHTIGVGAFSYCPHLKSVKMTAVERIEWLAFSNCYFLSEVCFGERLTNIAERAFEGCRSLTTLRLPASISEIGAGAFSGLPLESASIVCGDGEAYTPALGGERELAEMLSDRNAPLIRRKTKGTAEIPEGGLVNTIGLSLRLNGDGKSYKVNGPGDMDFYTKEINIGYHEDGRPVVEISEDAFENLERAGIETVRIGSTVKVIGNGAFCRAKFKELELSEGLVEIGDYAFYGCGIGSLRIPQSVKKIGKSAFYQCRVAAGELVLPCGLTRIEEESFSRLFEITGTLVIPAGVTYIGKGAFEGDLRLDGIAFADPCGWEYNGEPIDLSDPRKNAELLTDFFANELKKLG